MPLKLHRCPTPWKLGPCWRVEKALDEQGIDYEVVKGPVRPGKRVDLQRLSGQKLYPALEFEAGRARTLTVAQPIKHHPRPRHGLELGTR